MSEQDIFEGLHRPSPLVILLSGVSGVGKDAVVRALIQRNLPLHFVVTTTSRAPRPGELDGVDYYYVDVEGFEMMIAQNELIEHALVYGQYKGVGRKQVEEALASGKDLIFRLDVQGVVRLKAIFPQAVTIFLIPASKEEWIHRLKNRDSEMSAEEQQHRIEMGKIELDHLPEYDYVVVNRHRKLKEAVDIVEAIIHTEHHRVNHRRVAL